jgi:hypothetical protein
MHIAISAPSIIRENKKGGLWNRSMPKSATKMLVSIGWSIKALRIFLNITIPSITQMFGANVLKMVA